jgi:hypothetical protein
MHETIFTPSLSATLLGNLDLADDALFDWLDTFAIDIGGWATLAHRAEVARTASALSFRYQAPMLWRDIPDGEYGVIARYNHGGRHYAIPRTARLPDFAGAPFRAQRDAACQAQSGPTPSRHESRQHTL